MYKHGSCRLYRAITNFMTFQPAIYKRLDLPACVNITEAKSNYYKAKLIG